MTDEEFVIDAERSLLTPEVRGSAARLNELLSDDFTEYSSSGTIARKDDVIRALTGAVARTRYATSNITAHRISDDVIQVTFETDHVRADGTETHALRSSVWRKENGRWRMRFHQGTPSPAPRTRT